MEYAHYLHFGIHLRILHFKINLEARNTFSSKYFLHHIKVLKVYILNITTHK